ncbi:MAG: TonB-dependent receptor [Bacteroidales bacterium]|nr:TonB-dependent receptor [Bacteroidales bacterium]
MFKNYIKIISIISLFLLIFQPGFARGQNCVVKGKVTNGVNNSPVPYASVQVKGMNNGTITDESGNFTLSGLNPGNITLLVSSLGYQKTESGTIFLTNEKQPYIEIPMQPVAQNLKEVTITSSILRQSNIAPVSMQRLGIKQILDNPGSNMDISRVLQSLPGIGSTPNFRNDIIVRGGGPTESKFYLDGIEIPILNHFATQGASGGAVGILNADFIQSVNYYSSSFPADRPNALSGVFEFFLKEGNHEKTHFQLSLGSSNAALTLDGPIGKKTSYIFSVRQSYLQFIFSAIGLPFLPTFNDYQLKTKTQFNEKNQLTVISIGSLDKMTLNTSLSNPDPSQEYILSYLPVNNQWSYTIGANYKHFTKSGSHELVVSRNMLYNQLYKYPDNNTSLPRSLNYVSTQAENSLRYEFNMFKDGYSLNLSANTDFYRYTNNTTQQDYTSGNTVFNHYQTLLTNMDYGFSAQASKKYFKERLSVSLGFRFDGDNYNQKMKNLLNQFSPRASVSLSVTPELSISASTGRYFELPAFTTLGFKSDQGVLVNQSGATYIQANHYNLGLAYRPKENMFFSLTGFYKWYEGYPIDLVTGESLANEGSAYNSVVGDVPVSFSGNGKAYGFEFTHRLNLRTYTLIASYTYVRSEFTNLQGIFIPSSWDSRNLITITGSKVFKKNWQFGFKWRFVGGLPYTPYDLAKTANIQAWDAKGGPYFNYSLLNSERFGSFQELDLRIDKRYYFKKWALQLYLDIQNAYNFKNKGQDYIIRKKNASGEYMTTANGQDYVLESLPNLSGQALPSIGIIITL